MTFFVFSVFPAPDSPLSVLNVKRMFYTDTVDVRDQDALVFAVLAHTYPSSLCDGKDMRSIFLSPFVSILFNDCISV